MILGIDYGDKRVGLALSEDRGPAVPWQIIDNLGGRSKLIEQIQNIVLENNITAIVVGWPLSLEGKVTERTKITDDFIKALQAATDVEIILEDERLTTSSLTRNTGTNFYIDDKSAALILQSYIDQNNADQR